MRHWHAWQSKVCKVLAQYVFHLDTEAQAQLNLLVDILPVGRETHPDRVKHMPDMTDFCCHALQFATSYV